MTDAENRPAFHIGGDASGQFVVGDNNVVTSNQTSPIDLRGLARFATAVTEALPALQLDEEDQERARLLAAEIVREVDAPAADEGRLSSVGRSLRAIVEGAAAGALASGLLALWTP